MSSFVVNGGKSLSGSVKISGAKNSLLPILAATVLSGGVSEIHNCPRISDIFLAIQILKDIGCTVTFKDNVITVNSKDVVKTSLKPEFVKKMRGSVIFLGPLAGRFKEASLSYPGGCEIGSRPIDFHIDAIKKMGGLITEEDGIIHCRTEGLKGTEITLKYPSVGATENIMLAAALAQGTTTIKNAAKEPEISDLAAFITSMGGKIHGSGSKIITIEGVSSLSDTSFYVMPDRIETGTFMVASAITGGDIFIEGASCGTIKSVIEAITSSGAYISKYDHAIRVKGPKKIKALKEIKTLPYPGFPTDMQPQIMSLLTLAEGTSIIIETVFESRYSHIDELRKMGANIDIKDEKVLISGVKTLYGTSLFPKDLRSGAALILAGLAAQGTTNICNGEYILRGYEGIEKKLSDLGADISFFE
ncbi:MAG: UDP-N-acetylglucosamine 1-carboxyvinyltransferase [Lachnospiraceae bacterium]|nr:UDP-N-acetylglucosamine 1-carboxyvinyltransferase [Lachnospiraceae bacterium]